jgi:hypothetical protein
MLNSEKNKFLRRKIFYRRIGPREQGMVDVEVAACDISQRIEKEVSN